jgi:hypothetical protein
MSEDDHIAKAARAICAARCAHMGEEPCPENGRDKWCLAWEPGCTALAHAAVAALQKETDR